jgi:hypothetical protein
MAERTEQAKPSSSSVIPKLRAPGKESMAPANGASYYCHAKGSDEDVPSEDPSPPTWNTPL